MRKNTYPRLDDMVVVRKEDIYSLLALFLVCIPNTYTFPDLCPVDGGGAHFFWNINIFQFTREKFIK